MTGAEQELLEITRTLLDRVDQRDAHAYGETCAPDLTAFEPEAKGQRIDGLEFHEFFLTKPNPNGTTVRSEMVSPHVRVINGAGGEPAAGVVVYTRVTQKHRADGSFRLLHCNETRVYERRDGAWKHVHFHRSDI